MAAFTLAALNMLGRIAKTEKSKGCSAAHVRKLAAFIEKCASAAFSMRASASSRTSIGSAASSGKTASPKNCRRAPCSGLSSWIEGCFNPSIYHNFMPAAGAPFIFLNGMNNNGPIRCVLCEKVIDGYSREFNRLHIDETHSADICRGCLDKFVKWQQQTYAKLFPTAASKKFMEKRTGNRDSAVHLPMHSRSDRTY
ncbi:MAG: hypothetical protein JW913_06695 [Chitinispirillaceae bacterium]|nr:hypothetical protein [Chitinispirillaceae bacterium]